MRLPGALLAFVSLLNVISSFQLSFSFLATRTSPSLVSSFNQRLIKGIWASKKTGSDAITDETIEHKKTIRSSWTKTPRSESSRCVNKAAKGLLSSAAVVVPGVLATIFRQQPVNALDDQNGMNIQRPKRSRRPLVYSVEMTDPPCLQPRTTKGEIGVARRLSAADVVLMGEHYASDEDHQLEAKIIERIMRNGEGKKSITIGLEAVDFRYQKALDEYIFADGGSLIDADAKLKTETHWEEVWKICSFDSYLPVFHIAKEKKIKLVALGLPEDLKLRVKERGLDGLTEAEKSRAITDPQAFVNYVKTPGFARYAERVIAPAYQKLKSRGILGEKVTQESYLGYRIYEDEAMSTLISNYVSKDTTFVALVGNGRTKFGYGVQGRISRILNQRYDLGASSSPSTGENRKEESDVVSMLLNPTANDSESPTAQLLLTLAYGPYLKEQRPLANYLWFSEYPQIKILTRPKNPISAEGEKPAGESSIIGAFSAR